MEDIKEFVIDAIDFVEAKTKLDILIDDFKDHKVDDDKNFNSLFELVRSMPDKIEENMGKEFVTQKKFEVFQTEIQNSVNNACNKIDQTTTSIRNWIIWTVIGFIGGWSALAAILLYVKN